MKEKEFDVKDLTGSINKLQEAVNTIKSCCKYYGDKYEGECCDCCDMCPLGRYGDCGLRDIPRNWETVEPLVKIMI